MTKECENKTLELVREIGFDNIMGIGKKPTERIFFIGPQRMEGAETGAHATPEAIAEFIDYWEHQVAVAKDYVANGCNPNTMEWVHQSHSEPLNQPGPLVEGYLGEPDDVVDAAFNATDGERLDLAFSHEPLVETKTESVNRSCEYEQTMLLRFCAWLAEQNLLPNVHEAEVQTAYFIGSLSQSVSNIERVEALKCALVKQRGRDSILAYKYDRAVVLEFAEWWTNHRDRLHIPPGKREVDQFFAQRKS